MSFFSKLKNLFFPVDEGSTEGPHFFASQAAIDYFSRDDVWKHVVSSNVAAIGWFTSVKHGEQPCLGIKFLSGAFYLYDVKIGMYLAFTTTSSKGKLVWSALRRKKIPYAGPY